MTDKDFEDYLNGDDESNEVENTPEALSNPFTNPQSATLGNNDVPDSSSSTNDSTVSGNSSENKTKVKPPISTMKSSNAASKSSELKKSSNNGKKIAIFSGIGILAIGALGFGLYSLGFVEFTGESTSSGEKVLDPEEEKLNKQQTQIQDSKDDRDAFKASTKGKPFPQQVPKWERATAIAGSGLASDNEMIITAQNEASKKFDQLDYYSAATVLPSEAAGFTSDLSKMNNEDGSLNVMFSYWTRESFLRETNDLLARLSNPIYGNWSAFQTSGGLSSDDGARNLHDRFADVIPGFENKDKLRNTLPVYADWDSNDYGMGDQLLENSPVRWYGAIQSTETRFTYNDAKGQYDVDMTLNITYTAWGKDKKKLEKNAVMNLRLVANNDTLVKSNNRVVIESGSLAIL